MPIRYLVIFSTALLLLTGCDFEADPVVNDFPSVDAGDDIGEDTGHNDTGDTGQDADTNAFSPEPWDCDPDLSLDANGYAEVEELYGDDLAAELFAMVDGHTNRGYNFVRDMLFDALETRDDGKIECVYTGRKVEPDGTRTPDGFNTEHTWPRSRGANEEPELSDLHHLFPVDAHANNQRANFEFGFVDCDETTCPWHEGGSFLGPSADDDRDPVFEVRPDRRGDIARAILYFSIRYQKAISPEEEAVLRQWNCENPPDRHERFRNSYIGEIQRNRNPFIDRPDFVDRIGEF